MLDIRLQVVMGHAVASAWCTSCRPAHCIWRGSQYAGDPDPATQLELLSRAAATAVRDWCDGKYEISPDCAR